MCKKSEHQDNDALEDLQKFANTVRTFSISTDTPEDNISLKSSISRDAKQKIQIKSGSKAVREDESEIDEIEITTNNFNFFKADKVTPITQTRLLRNRKP